MKRTSVGTTSIPGLLTVDLAVHRDERGWFKESFQREHLAEQGLTGFDVVQSNVSFNEQPGVTRGIHAEPWDKYISLAQGRAFAAIVDLRAGPAFGRVATVELHVGNAIFVPRGCGNSYQTLTPNVAYTYLVNAHWSPEAEYTFVNLFDPQLAIAWPLPQEQVICSAKDRGHPPLSSIEPLEPPACTP